MIFCGISPFMLNASLFKEMAAQGWCTGMAPRDAMGREVGRGSRWGTHIHPWLIHVNVWQKSLQYCD